LFAVNHHSAMKHAIGPRRELKFRTIFNLLGPLTNPAGAKRQVLGVFDSHWLTPMAEVLGRLGATRAMVVHSRDGLDEISPVAVTDVAEWDAGAVRAFQIEPGSLDCALPSLDALKVADATESLEMIKGAFSGKHDAAEKMIALNAGAALYVADAAQSLQEGVDQARDEMRSGRALEKLEALVAFSQESAQ
jgi:anthranilate phosphoribosyltransferase